MFGLFGWVLVLRGFVIIDICLNFLFFGNVVLGK